MSDITLPPLTDQTAGVVSRLAALRSQIAAWFWVDGLSRVLWLLLGLCAADFVLDWLFHLDKAQRLVMLALAAGAIGWLAYRRLVRPLSVTMSDDALALQVEAENKQLGQSMISALQLARIEDIEGKGMSPALVRQTVATGTRAAENVNFASVLDGKEFRLSAVLLALAVLALGGLAVGVRANDSLNIWFNRNVLLGDRTWPQDTYLEIERAADGKVVFPRGEDWTQVVRVREESKVIPDAVYIDFRHAGGRPPQAMKRRDDGKFEAVFNNVIEPFQFRARGGDAVTEWVQVELVEQPAVQSLTLVVTPPQYTGGSPTELPPGKGPYYVLAGSSLAVAGQANKPLVKAELRLEGKLLIPPPQGAAEVKQDYSLPLSEGVNFSGTIEPNQLVAGQYTFILEDTLGLTGRRPTSLAVRERIDREPRVRVRLIGVSGMVVPKARVPFTCRVTDDFGVTLAEVRYHWRGDDMANADGQGTLPLEGFKDQLGQVELSLEDALELEPLAIPTGTGFNFHFAAVDNRTVPGREPNTGKSSDLLLRIVTEEELRTDMLRREKEQRQEFERLLKNQEELLTDCRALLAGIKGSENIPPAAKDQLMQYQKRQKLVGQNTGAIAERFASIVIEVQNNRLEEEGGRLQSRLTNDIITPMQEVAAPLVPEVMQLLDRTRRQASVAADRDQALTDATVKQQAIVERMQQILTHMVKSEGFQEAVNLLYEIQKVQSDVHEQTNKERQERIKRILEGGGAGDKPTEIPADPPKP
ncbi:MAG: hypothetical protein L0211_17470 [Planctomycetaceae bacterium]|nr:hypothetical protein [Planctomycetaceae bacterium]